MSAAECAKGNHDFIPIGHEHTVTMAEPTRNEHSNQLQYPIDGNVVQWWVVRACANCPKVWWQEYDPVVARALTHV